MPNKHDLHPKIISVLEMKLLIDCENVFENGKIKRYTKLSNKIKEICLNYLLSLSETGKTLEKEHLKTDEGRKAWDEMFTKNDGTATAEYIQKKNFKSFVLTYEPSLKKVFGNEYIKKPPPKVYHTIAWCFKYECWLDFFKTTEEQTLKNLREKFAGTPYEDAGLIDEIDKQLALIEKEKLERIQINDEEELNFEEEILVQEIKGEEDHPNPEKEIKSEVKIEKPLNPIPYTQKKPFFQHFIFRTKLIFNSNLLYEFDDNPLNLGAGQLRDNTKHYISSYFTLDRYNQSRNDLEREGEERKEQIKQKKENPEDILEFMKKFVFADKKFYGNNTRYFLILSPSGIGKTTLLLKLFIYSKFKNHKNKVCILPFSERSRVNEIKGQEKSILILDAIDEDFSLGSNESLIEAFEEIKKTTSNFHKVIISSRNQFFKSNDDISSFIKTIDTADNFTVITPLLVRFTDSQIKQYINKKFKGLGSRKKSKKAKKIVNDITGKNIADIKGVPISKPISQVQFLISKIDFLIENKSNFIPLVKEFEYFNLLIEKWSKRELNLVAEQTDKSSTARIKAINKTNEFSELLAKAICENPRTYFEGINIDEIKKILELNEENKAEDEIKESKQIQILANRTFLVKDNDRNYRFIHKSIFEFFLAKVAIKDKEFNSSIFYTNYTSKEGSFFTTSMYKQGVYFEFLQAITTLNQKNLDFCVQYTTSEDDAKLYAKDIQFEPFFYFEETKIPFYKRGDKEWTYLEELKSDLSVINDIKGIKFVCNVNEEENYWINETESEKENRLKKRKECYKIMSPLFRFLSNLICLDLSEMGLDIDGDFEVITNKIEILNLRGNNALPIPLKSDNNEGLSTITYGNFRVSTGQESVVFHKNAIHNYSSELFNLLKDSSDLKQLNIFLSHQDLEKGKEHLEDVNKIRVLSKVNNFKCEFFTEDRELVEKEIIDCFPDVQKNKLWTDDIRYFEKAGDYVNYFDNQGIVLQPSSFLRKSSSSDHFINLIDNKNETNIMSFDEIEQSFPPILNFNDLTYLKIDFDLINKAELLSFGGIEINNPFYIFTLINNLEKLDQCNYLILNRLKINSNNPREIEKYLERSLVDYISILEKHYEKHFSKWTNLIKNIKGFKFVIYNQEQFLYFNKIVHNNTETLHYQFYINNKENYDLNFDWFSKLNKLNKLNKLILKTQSTFTQLDFEFIRNLKLEELVIETGGGTVINNTVIREIELITIKNIDVLFKSKTLKKLTLDFEQYSSNELIKNIEIINSTLEYLFIKKSTLFKLKKLNYKFINVGELRVSVLEGVLCIKNIYNVFPNVKVLKLHSTKIENIEYLKYYEKLKSLLLEINFNTISIKKLINIFPEFINIDEIELIFNNIRILNHDSLEELINILSLNNYTNYKSYTVYFSPREVTNMGKIYVGNYWMKLDVARAFKEKIMDMQISPKIDYLNRNAYEDFPKLLNFIVNLFSKKINNLIIKINGVLVNENILLNRILNITPYSENEKFIDINYFHNTFLNKKITSNDKFNITYIPFIQIRFLNTLIQKDFLEENNTFFYLEIISLTNFEDLKLIIQNSKYDNLKEIEILTYFMSKQDIIKVKEIKKEVEKTDYSIRLNHNRYEIRNADKGLFETEFTEYENCEEE